MAIRVRDLPEQPGPGVQLYCYRCGDSYSAYRGDYFLRAPDAIFRCEHCHCNLTLVEKRTTHREIQV